MTIHDHFDGAGHCVECGGNCQLRGEDRALTELIRFTCEFFAFVHNGWMPDWIEKPIQGILGERWPEFRKRSLGNGTMRPIKKARG